MKINTIEVPDDNLLVICPNSYKNVLLETFNSEKKIVDIKFYDLNEYKRNYFFDYDISAVKYLVDKYNLSVSNAKELIDNLIYVEEGNNYGVEKLDLLVEYKKQLQENKLLVVNPLFLNYINNKNVLVIGYGKLPKFEQSIIKGKTVTYIEEQAINKNYSIYEFDSIENEVEYLYDSIFDLLKKDIDINNIYVLNCNDEYNTYFKRFNTYYPFKIETKNNTSIFGLEIVDSFIEMLNCKDKEEIYDYLNNTNSNITSVLINILNKYAAFDLKDVKEFIIDDIKKTKINKEYTNIVRCVDLDTSFNSNDYVFLIGFNDKVPHTSIDDKYITNNIRNLVNLSSIEEENELIKYNFINHISNINNLYLSYFKSSPFNSYNKQNVISDVEYKNYTFDNDHSIALNKLKYAYMLDRLNKYGVKDDDLADMYNTYGRNDYLKYDNTFKGLNSSAMDKVTLSYSSMTSYYECSFRYYLDKVLGINNFEETFYTLSGTLCHNVLERMYEDAFDFNVIWQEELLNLNKQGKTFADDKQLYFINKIKDELELDIEIIRKQNENSCLNKYICEGKNKTYEIAKDISFVGYIDKVMYNDNGDEVIASVVDYKTGSSDKIDKELFKYGLSLQLPSYLYLLRNNEKFKECLFGGFYLQHLINKDRNYKDGETLEDKKFKSMLLDGYSSNNISRLQMCDLSIESGTSDVINALKINKSGEIAKNCKTISDEDIDALVTLVEDKIKNAGQAILDNNFKINPKMFKDDNISCKYCEYKDICFMRNKDIEKLDKES